VFRQCPSLFVEFAWRGNVRWQIWHASLIAFMEDVQEFPEQSSLYRTALLATDVPLTIFHPTSLVLFLTWMIFCCWIFVHSDNLRIFFFLMSTSFPPMKEKIRVSKLYQLLSYLSQVFSPFNMIDFWNTPFYLIDFLNRFFIDAVLIVSRRA